MSDTGTAAPGPDLPGPDEVVNPPTGAPLLEVRNLGKYYGNIIAAVVGGNLLTGGYGSAAGGAIGSLIMSMSTQGIPFAGWNSNWRFLFLGVILLLAVAGNNYVRRKAEQIR